MLHHAKRMLGATLEAADGKLADFLFDDRDWTIKNLVLDAGTWLNSRRVTLPPELIRHKDWADHRLMIAGLTRQQVLQSPNVETHVTVGETKKLETAAIIDWGLYWIQMIDHPWQVSNDPHLRSTEEMIRYHLREIDGRMGHLADFLIDDEAWKIRFLEADTRNWWLGKHVLIAPERVEHIDGPNRIVYLNLSREELERSLANLPASEETVPYESMSNAKM